MTTPTAGQWIHDRAQLEALPDESLISDRHGRDHQCREGEWNRSGSLLWTDADQIALPVRVWRVGPAPEWGSNEIVDGEAETGAPLPLTYTVGDRIGGPLFGPGGLFPDHDTTGGQP